MEVILLYLLSCTLLLAYSLWGTWFIGEDIYMGTFLEIFICTYVPLINVIAFICLSVEVLRCNNKGCLSNIIIKGRKCKT